jgi:hypothetical protein
MLATFTGPPPPVRAPCEVPGGTDQCPAAADAAPLWGGRAAARYEGWVIEDTAAEGVEEEEEEEGCCCCNWRDGDCPARPASGRPPKMKSVRVAIPPRFKRSSVRRTTTR